MNTRTTTACGSTQVVLKDVTIKDDLVHFNVHLAIQEQGGDNSFTGSVPAVVIAQLA